MAELELGADHRETLRHIFARPSSSNVEWRQVLSLLEALGAATERPNGRVEVTLGGESEVFDRPHGKDVDEQMLEDLRRMLTAAGFSG